MFYRQIRQARRNGPLRYIIPHPDDLPPPYSHYGPASMTLNQNDNADGHQGNVLILKNCFKIFSKILINYFLK